MNCEKIFGKSDEYKTLKQPSVYVDLDSTLNNLTLGWLNSINYHYNTTYKMSDVTSFWWFKELQEKNPELKVMDLFFQDKVYPFVGTFPGAKQFLENLRVLEGIYDVAILTSTIDGSQKTKQKHINQYFSDQIVIHEHDKWKFARKLDKTPTPTPNILVDDRYSNCVKWVKNGGYAILFNYHGVHHHNVQDKHEILENMFYITDYDQAIYKIKEIIEIIGGLND